MKTLKVTISIFCLISITTSVLAAPTPMNLTVVDNQKLSQMVEKNNGGKALTFKTLTPPAAPKLGVVTSAPQSKVIPPSANTKSAINHTVEPATPLFIDGKNQASVKK